MDKLRTLLKAVMLRREKSSLLGGKPIVELPDKKETVIHVALSKEESQTYKRLEEGARAQYRIFLNADTIGKNYHLLLVRLLRMRQACCHPHLHLDVDDLAPAIDPKMTDAVKTLPSDVVTRSKSKPGFECPICFDAVQDPSFLYACGHYGCSTCLSHLFTEREASDLRAGLGPVERNRFATCPVCRRAIDLTKTFTYTAFRNHYMPPEEAKEEEKDEGVRKSEKKPKLDYVDLDSDDDGLGRYFRASKEGTESPYDSDVSAEERSTGKRKRHDGSPLTTSKLRQLRAAAVKSDAFRATYFSYLERTWRDSTKVTACVKLIKEIQESGEKTIVFSQWTLFLDLIQTAINKEGLLKTVRYDGSMSAVSRDMAVRQFREKPKVKVMLVGLKAGNAGLNLTVASRVIIMDPFWNPYVEMQAVDRTHRIGQRRNVRVYRILCKDTVEDRIVELQERKKAMVDSALDEKASKHIGRLGLAELRYLLGGGGKGT